MRAWTALCAGMFIACSDGPAAPGDAHGTFRASLSNALTETITGPARYFLFVDTASTVFRVEFGDIGSARGFTLTILGDGGRPGVGTFAIVAGPGASPQPPTVFASACADNSQQCFTNWRVDSFSSVNAGQLEIVKSTSGSLAGSLEVDLQGDGPVSGQMLHVSAKFNATCNRQLLTC